MQYQMIISGIFCLMPFISIGVHAGTAVPLHTEKVPAYAAYEIILQRMFPELDHAAVARQRAPSGITFDPAAESWDMLLPHEDAPDTGYRVLIWIDPLEIAEIPDNWHAILDDFDMLLVTARNAGNRHSVTERRAPLALTGLAAVQSRYPINAREVYVGGFSGGSKTAQMLAFGFPDIFRGALLNGGFLDPRGEQINWPPVQLRDFLRQTRFYLVAGGKDELARRDFSSLQNVLEGSDLEQVAYRVVPFASHARLPEDEFRKALQFLTDK